MVTQKDMNDWWLKQHGFSPEDIRVETMRGPDPNSPDTYPGVRVVHIPTGESAECESKKSAVANKKWALTHLFRKMQAKKLQALRNSL